MSITPLREKVVIERTQAESQSAGGIVIPESAREKPQRGTVIAVGSGQLLENGQVRAPEVKEGDQVLFGGYAGSEVNVDGKKYLIVSESEIFAIVAG